MHRYPALLLLMAGCAPEGGLKVHNDAPEISIVAPAGGSVLPEGGAITFAADVSDRQDANEDLSFYWTLLDGSTLVGEQTVTETGVTLVVTEGLDAGDYTVGLKVLDSGSAEGEDSVTFTVTPDAPPVLAFVTPVNEARYAHGDLVYVDLLVEDAEEANIEDVTLSWNGEATAGAPSTPTADGHATFYTPNLDIGSWSLAVTATDSLGHGTSASVVFDVVDPDGDGDGYEATEWGGGDCDDSDDTVNPSVTELCNGVDDDCDGSTDEDDATDANEYYADADEDGFGDAGSTAAACEAPVGYVANAADCDDTDGAEYPGAVEVCDGDDDDCDGAVDEADAVDPAAWYADADGDGYGTPGSPEYACDAPEGTVANASDCDDGNPRENPAALEVCDGDDDDCDGVTDEADAIDASTWYADADADGFGDASSLTAACDQPSGHVGEASDCDDTDTGTYPGAAETCDGEDDDCDGTIDEDTEDAPTWYADADGDLYGDPDVTTSACTVPSGYTDDSGDCDDADAGIGPSAAEICDDDDIDEDCNGLADDADSGTVPASRSPWYADADGDTYGDPGDRLDACDPPFAYVSDSDDCDDSARAISPAATEICNDVDDDCDGLTDDADSPVSGGSTWYRDADADGFGSSTTAVACDAPSGYAASSTDCNDAAAAVNPGATESCGTSADDDCDGDANDPGATDCVDFYVDRDADGRGGTASACLCEVNATYSRTTATDCDDADDDVYPGAEDTCENGDDEDCDGTDDACALEGTIPLSTADAKFTGSSAGIYSGQTVAGGADIGSDGYPDILIGAYFTTSSLNYVWIVNTPVSGDVALSSVPTRVNGDSLGDRFGTAISTGPDIDGDGAGDWAVGAPNSDQTASSAGSVYLFDGQPAAGYHDASDIADFIFTGSTATDYLGYSTTLVNSMDADSVGEVVMGAYGQDSAGSAAGAVYFFYGPVTGSVTQDVLLADGRINGESSNDQLGFSVADAGDFDGDGLTDVVVGAPGDDDTASNSGAAYVFFDGPAATVSASTYDLKVLGEAGGDGAGQTVAGAGDVDGDGLDDIVIGAPDEDTSGTSAGAAYLVLGGSTDRHSLGSLREAKLTGIAAYDYAGIALDGAGDVDADGYADLLIGSQGDDTSGPQSGSAYLLYGPVAGTLSLSLSEARLRGETAYDYAGCAVAGAGDTDDDGFDDLLIGAYGDDDGASLAGATYLLFGAAR